MPELKHEVFTETCVLTLMLKNKEVQLQALPNITENAMYDLKNLEYALV